jgi:hypothetical protein
MLKVVVARHVGRGPCFIDEDQALGIEVELPIEPGFAPLRDVGTILLRGVRRLFLRVMALRTKKRWIVPKPKVRPCALSVWRTYSMVASLSGPSVTTTASWQAWMRCERRSPPSAFGLASPCSRFRVRQRLTLAALTPNRSPASRWLAPACTAARTRILRSSDSAFDIPKSSEPFGGLNQNHQKKVIPIDSFSSGYALAPQKAGFLPIPSPCTGRKFTRLPNAKEPAVEGASVNLLLRSL